MLQSNPVSSIKDFILEASRESDLPFLATLSPDDSWEPLATASFKEYEIPLFHGITVTEQWLFEVLEAKFENRKSEVRLSYVDLVNLIQQYFKCDRVTAMGYVDPIMQGREALPGEIPEADDKTTAIAKVELTLDQISEFRQKHHEKLTQIVSLSNAVGSIRPMQIFKATIFMRQRVNGAWDFSDTIKLFGPDLEALNKIIEGEVNGGQPTIIPDAEPAMGKPESEEKRTSRRSTTKLQEVA